STSGASTSRRQGVDRAVELNHVNEHNNNSDDFSHRSGLNCARDFHERQQTPRLLLPTPIICHYCRAKLFHGETRNFCCNGGKIVLPEVPVPSELYNLFTDQSAEAGRQGVYAFRAHGTMYHKIGTLLPSPGTRPRYIQMFIYDTEHEIENRLLENNGLDRGLVEKIKHILDVHNPFVQNYGNLLNEMIYLIIETQKLKFIRTHQQDIRAELYQGLQDCLNGGEDDAGNVGRRTILPSSFVGSPRDMYQRYQDAMSVVQKFGKPDLFITMTCNPSWEEIQNELKPRQTPQDRPDLLTRIFRAKFEELKKDIYTKGVLGKVVAHVHVIEFQKRGLPHAHILVILDENDKLNTPDDYDHIVRAEIPDKNDEPMLYEAVMRHMIHGPCGEMNVNAPCMKNGTCKKNYPKPFAPCTIQGTDSYPIYRRRDDNRSISLDRNCDVVVDNGWVVPYNPWLLLNFQRISDVLSDERNSRTMLTEFFRVYNEGQEPNQYLYSEFPKYYRWMSNEKVWQKRRSQQKVIGRDICYITNEGERFYLRILLNHVRGPKSFDDLLTVNNLHYPTFKQAAEKRGFLEEDDSIRQCLSEARAVRMPSALRRLFATILLYCQPTGVRQLWEENYPYMIEDYPSSSSTNNVLILNKLLHEINSILLQHKRSLKEFDLPQIAEDYQDLRSISSLIEDELSIPIPLDDLNAVSKLNPDQLRHLIPSSMRS
ncbi:UNVERIFIED_CONTAM: hypothetical protein Sangu_2463800, partial [Sesamum angustifolium]